MSKQHDQEDADRVLSPLSLLMKNNNNTNSSSNNNLNPMQDSNGSSNGQTNLAGGNVIAPENLSYLFSVWRMGGDFNKAKAM